MSETDLLEALSFDEYVFYELVTIMKEGNPAAFIHLYKTKDNGEYDRLHVLHTLTDLPLSTLAQMLRNNKKLEQQFAQCEEVFNDDQEENIEKYKYQSLHKCSDFLAPTFH